MPLCPEIKYHIGFGRGDLGDDPPAVVLLCGDPDRTCSEHVVESLRMQAEYNAIRVAERTVEKGCRLRV